MHKPCNARVALNLQDALRCLIAAVMQQDKCGYKTLHAPACTAASTCSHHLASEVTRWHHCAFCDVVATCCNISMAAQRVLTSTHADTWEACVIWTSVSQQDHYKNNQQFQLSAVLIFLTQNKHLCCISMQELLRVCNVYMSDLTHLISHFIFSLCRSCTPHLTPPYCFNELGW